MWIYNVRNGKYLFAIVDGIIMKIVGKNGVNQRMNYFIGVLGKKSSNSKGIFSVRPRVYPKSKATNKAIIPIPKEP